LRKERYLTASVVIVAAGKSTRMNMNINKQFIEISGLPVLARTMKVFEDCDLIREVVLVVNEADIVYCKQEIVDRFGFYKVKCIVAGGAKRQESVSKGLSEVDSDCGVVLIHDGARPFVREECIADCINTAYEFGAACVAVPVKDTIKEADRDNFIQSTLDRSSIWAIQTPQGFKREIIMDAHRKAAEDGFSGTDDAVLVERIGVRIKLVMGSYCNIKITTREDLVFAEAIAQAENI
jgi:2-C-methyl-D-erythritol 4-phosphate cytidylyltransferase